MREYHKIQTIFNRDPNDNFKTLLPGQFSKPEFEYLKDNNWLVEEKIDGTNIRIMWNGLNMKIGGKTDDAQLHADLITAIQTLITPEKLAAQFGVDMFPGETEPQIEVCLYGEGYGPGIQKGGGNYRKDKGFILFDVRVGKWWLERQNVRDVAVALGMDMVPELGILTLEDCVAMCKIGFKSKFGDFEAEGIIARPTLELKNRYDERIITKLKCRDFDGLK